MSNDYINRCSRSNVLTLQLTGWLPLPVQRDVYLEINLESVPLEIRTNSLAGSNDKVVLFFYSARREYAGEIVIYFTTPPSYHFGWCSKKPSVNFSPYLPSAKDKIWRISLTRTAALRIVIHCNNVEVVNILMSDSTCVQSQWSNKWNKDVTKIKFKSSDTASDYYNIPLPGD